jgi:hypothetical protein
MKPYFYILICAALASTLGFAQETRRPAPARAQPRAEKPASYAADLAVIQEAQEQVLEQAKEMLAGDGNVRDRAALEAAIKEMERAQAALQEAKKAPQKIAAALAAQQAAYQALLKVVPREYNMTRSQRGNQSGQSQSQQRQLSQLDMQREENRYETERQAAAPPNARQREQSQVADRLKELSQRQQDLNERMRELQTALQAANTDQERTEVQRQLKRLQEEQRQMLANVDELRQKLEQSPDASAQAETQKQLEQTRTDMERAAQELDRQSASGALAAGTRAQETMQNLRDDLRKQTSSQFAEQMRELRQQARELTKQQDEIARGLEALNNDKRQALDNSGERKAIVQQMQKQQGALTNLLAEMRTVTEQAEATEPLLAKQLYDTLRRADQMRTENLLEMGAQLTERGFLPQASQVERATRTNLTELVRGVERAADSVLGSEADALRYAQKELDDLARQVERELAGVGTNVAGNLGANSVAQARERSPANGAPADGNSSVGPRSENSPSAAPSGNPDQQSIAADSNAGQASAQGSQTGRGNNSGQENRSGNQPQVNNAPDGSSPRGESLQAGGNRGGGERLRQLAVQLGAGGERGGPITGNNYGNWTERLREVEQVVDPADLRNQLTAVRERASGLRAEYRDRGRLPQADVVRDQILMPLTQVRVWLREELARKEKSDGLVPLDRDPVPDHYAELVRKYYEKLGSAP